MTINIDPKKFDNITMNPLNHINNKWFINLTNATIPPYVSSLLQLGGNFNLPIDNNKKIAIHEFVKDLESCNRHINDTDTTKIRNTIIPFFHRFIHKKTSNNKIENILLSLEKSTTIFCKNNPNIIFTRADKGNVTVASNRDEYIKKIELMLQDNNTYITVEKNPISNLEKNLNIMLKKWLQQGFISPKPTYFSFSSDSILPKAYGLLKVHKKKLPF